MIRRPLGFTLATALTIFVTLGFSAHAAAQSSDPGSTDPAQPTSDPAPSQPTPADPTPAPAADPAPPQESLAEREARQREADRAAQQREEDDESPTIFWLEGVVGASYIDIISFSQDNFIPEAERMNGIGFTGGAAAGFKLFIITLGARATISTFEMFDLGTIAFDLGLRIPTPIVEIYARVGAGYAWMGAADWQSPSMSDTSVFGLMVDAGAGFDFYLMRNIAIGAGLDFAFLNLGRQAGCSAADCGIANVDFTQDGNGAGLQLRFLAHLRFEI